MTCFGQRPDLDMCLNMGVSQEGRRMLETHIVRLKTSLYCVERSDFVLCGNEGASVPRVLRSFP